MDSRAAGFVSATVQLGGGYTGQFIPDRWGRRADGYYPARFVPRRLRSRLI